MDQVGDLREGVPPDRLRSFFVGSTALKNGIPYSNSQACNANQIILFIPDADIPDLGSPSQMNNGSTPIHPSPFGGPEMICIDFKANTEGFLSHH